MSNDQYNFAMPGNDNADSNSGKDEEGSYKRLLGDKPITWFWLMQHYSKANAEAYKRQKEERKNGKAGKQTAKTTAGKDAAIQVAPAPQQNGNWNSNGQSGMPVPGGQNGWQQQQGFPGGYPQYAVNPGQNPQASYSGGYWQGGAQPEDPALQPISGAGGNSWKSQAEGDNFGETIILRDDGSMVSTQKKEMPYNVQLECIGYGQNVAIRRFPCRIGRDSEQVDICISDNRAIGRLHAQIEKNGDEFYIVDLNSRNHVFIDGNAIKPYERTRLNDGTSFRLANEEFVIHIRAAE